MFVGVVRQGFWIGPAPKSDLLKHRPQLTSVVNGRRHASKYGTYFFLRWAGKLLLLQLDATVNTEASLLRLVTAILAELSDDWKPENDT